MADNTQDKTEINLALIPHVRDPRHVSTHNETWKSKSGIKTKGSVNYLQPLSKNYQCNLMKTVRIAHVLHPLSNTLKPHKWCLQRVCLGTLG